MRKHLQRVIWGILSAFLILAVTGCGVRSKAGITGMKAADGGPVRVVATSPAVVDIMARLDMDLVGVPASTLSVIPARYEDAVRVGTAM